MMYGDEKSDPFIVAGKPANGDGRPEPERVERRGGAEENTGQTSTRRTPSRASVSPGLDRVRTAASPSNIQGGSRMRECRTSGSVRGVPSNGRPYRNRWAAFVFAVGSPTAIGAIRASKRLHRTQIEARKEAERWVEEMRLGPLRWRWLMISQ